MMRAELRVQVRLNRWGADREVHPWLVTCEICAGGTDFFSGIFAGGGLKGWAATWRHAQDYADQHARAHEARRCPTCLHMPPGKLPQEASA